ncbi:MAG: DNA mismatch repair protein MutS, partial [Chloroflexi bacterium]
MITPARQQYLRLKSEHPDAILLYRLGDFYEAFDDDAHTLHQVLGITLTSRSFGRTGRVPMAGIPYHALHGYLRRLLRAGLRIAICEQVSEPGNGLVEREVVRVLSPGTLDDPALLDEQRSNYLLAIAQHGVLLGMAWVDVTTGACEYHALPLEDESAVSALISLLDPAEVLAQRSDRLSCIGERIVRVVDCSALDERVVQDFQARCSQNDPLRPAHLAAFTVLLAYLQHGHQELLDALETPLPYAAGHVMALDLQTRQNLELDLRSKGRPDLFRLLNATRTAPGARLLRSWLHRPLVDSGAIETRLDGVSFFHQSTALRLNLQRLLSGVRDLERLATRAGAGRIGPRELEALAVSLTQAQAISEALSAERTLPSIVAAALEDIDPLPALLTRINATLGENGDLVRAGWDTELDALRARLEEEQTSIQALVQYERERTGIKSLKSGYNKVAGYYFEVSRANRKFVPADAERRQTLTNVERYVTEPLR